MANNEAGAWLGGAGRLIGYIEGDRCSSEEQGKEDARGQPLSQPWSKIYRSKKRKNLARNKLSSGWASLTKNKPVCVIYLGAEW